MNFLAVRSWKFLVVVRRVTFLAMGKNRRRSFFDIAIDGREAGRIVFELFDDVGEQIVSLTFPHNFFYNPFYAINFQHPRQQKTS